MTGEADCDMSLFDIPSKPAQPFGRVAVNGSHFMEYPHRIHFASVDTLSIAGTVNVYSISFTQNQDSVADHERSRKPPIIRELPELESLLLCLS
ncbi:unnamed protein product [Lampetra planeri]